MLISKPSPLLSTGAGFSSTATVVTNTAGLFDGRSGASSELAWPAGNSLSFDVSWSAGISPRIAALVNLTGLANTDFSVTVALKEVGGDYTYQSGSVDVRAHLTNERSAVRVFDDGLNSCDGARFTITDTDGAMTEGDPIGIGEVVVADAWDIALAQNLSDGWAETAGENLSKSGQLYLQPVPAGRKIDVSSVMADIETVYGAMAAAQASLANDPRALVIVDPGTQDEIWRAWMYARASAITSKNFDGSARASASMEFREIVGLSNF